MVVNNEEIYPLPVLAGLEEYPFSVMEELKGRVENIKVIDASRIAEELGEPRSQNIVMLGALVKALDLQSIDWVELIKQYLPERFHKVNIKAFERGGLDE